MHRREFIGILLAMLSACAAPPAGQTPRSALAEITPTGQGTGSAPTVLPSPISTPTQCSLQPVIAPTRTTSGVDGDLMDLATGLHVTGEPPETLDLAAYRLKVTGKVNHPLSLSLDDLRCLPSVSSREALICPGFFEDDLVWTGVPFFTVLEMAGIQSEAKYIRLLGADGYVMNLDRAVVLADGTYLGYQLDFSQQSVGSLATDQPLPVRNGFPVRAVLPHNPGSRWVKWLVELQVN